MRATLVVKGLRGPSLQVRSDGLWRATRTRSGPATVRMRLQGRELRVDAWGEGADEALDRIPDWVGESDDPTALAPRHPAVERAARLEGGCGWPRWAVWSRS